MLYRRSVSLLHILLTQDWWQTWNSDFKSTLTLSSHLDLGIWIEEFSLDFKVKVTYKFFLPSSNLYVPSFPLWFDHLGSIRWSLTWLCDLLKISYFLLFFTYKLFIQYIFLSDSLIPFSSEVERARFKLNKTRS